MSSVKSRTVEVTEGSARLAAQKIANDRKWMQGALSHLHRQRLASDQSLRKQPLTGCHCADNRHTHTHTLCLGSCIKSAFKSFSGGFSSAVTVPVHLLRPGSAVNRKRRRGSAEGALARRKKTTREIEAAGVCVRCLSVSSRKANLIMHHWAGSTAASF